MQDLGTLGGSYSAGGAINASGQVEGDSDTAGGDTHAFLWDGTRMQDLGTLGGRISHGRAINDSGQVTGYAYTAGGATLRAFRWNGTRMQGLGTLGGRDSIGHAINAAGQVTGYSNMLDGSTHAFLWDGTSMENLGTLEGLDSYGLAINASGQVTGNSFMRDGSTHAFLWNGTRMRDLNALIDPADPLQPSVTLFEGVDINDRGQILANGVDSRTGEEHAYLVSPVPDSLEVAFTLRPRSLAFGEQPIGSSTTLYLWLRNRGTAPLTIQQVSLRGTDRSQFALRHRCGTALAAGAVCGVVVTFHPTSAGSKTARVRLIAGDTTRIRELSGIAR
jgi:probable HAF family extracellular repeat protein